MKLIPERFQVLITKMKQNSKIWSEEDGIIRIKDRLV